LNVETLSRISFSAIDLCVGEVPGLLFAVAAKALSSHLLVCFPLPSTTVRDGRKYDQPTFHPVSRKKLDTNPRGLP